MRGTVDRHSLDRFVDPSTSCTIEAAAESTPDATTMTPPPTASDTPVGAAPADPLSLQLCSNVPVTSTSVIGADTTMAGPDPVFQGVLLTYAQEHTDTFGGMWIDRDAHGTIVLAFTDDPEPHRAALAQRRPSADDVDSVEPMPAITDDRPIGEWGVAFDMVQVVRTEAELLSSANAVMAALTDAGLTRFGTGTDIMRNRVMLVPPQPPTDEEATGLSAVIDTVAALDAVCLEGTIVDVRPAPIAPGTPLDVVLLPDADGTYPPGTEVQCGAVR